MKELSGQQHLQLKSCPVMHCSALVHSEDHVHGVLCVLMQKWETCAKSQGLNTMCFSNRTYIFSLWKSCSKKHRSYSLVSIYWWRMRGTKLTAIRMSRRNFHRKVMCPFVMMSPHKYRQSQRKTAQSEAPFIPPQGLALDFLSSPPWAEIQRGREAGRHTSWTFSHCN